MWCCYIVIFSIALQTQSVLGSTGITRSEIGRSISKRSILDIFQTFPWIQKPWTKSSDYNETSAANTTGSTSAIGAGIARILKLGRSIRSHSDGEANQFQIREHPGHGTEHFSRKRRSYREHKLQTREKRSYLGHGIVMHEIKEEPEHLVRNKRSGRIALARSRRSHPGHNALARSIRSHPGHNALARSKRSHPGHNALARSKRSHPGHNALARSRRSHPGHELTSRSKRSHPGHTSFHSIDELIQNTRSRTKRSSIQELDELNRIIRTPSQKLENMLRTLSGANFFGHDHHNTQASSPMIANFDSVFSGAAEPLQNTIIFLHQGAPLQLLQASTVSSTFSPELSSNNSAASGTPLATTTIESVSSETLASRVPREEVEASTVSGTTKSDSTTETNITSTIETSTPTEQTTEKSNTTTFSELEQTLPDSTQSSTITVKPKEESVTTEANAVSNPGNEDAREDSHRGLIS